ncbi:MAG: DUF4179 domain-containing protein [Clostridia bacterium]|nr:DUF4179 domain-containing protein [Clostridia bacterium]
MLNERIEKTLQEHAPVPPAGFAERSDAQVLKMMADQKKKHGFSWKAVLVCALVIVMGITTALAATVEDVNTLLYKCWPEAAEFLMPLNVSCEDQGIRMEVLSAAAGRRNALVTFSLQDLEGDRINEYTRAEISLEQLFVGFSETESGIVQLSWDPETKTAVYAQDIKTNGISMPGGAHPTLAVNSLYTPEHVLVDLLPLMKQYPERTDTVPLPEAAYPMALETYSGKIPEGMEILDPAGSLEIPLEEHTYLCGYGWIDGLLHVQVRYDNQPDEEGVNPVNGHIRLQTAAGYNPYEQADRLPEGVVGFWWDENDDGPVDREEYLFACDPADLETAVLQADIRINTPDAVLPGNWSVRIPMRMIRSIE